MEYQLNSVLVLLTSCLANYVTSAPVMAITEQAMTPEPESIFELVDDREVDFGDQVDNLIDLAGIFMNIGYLTDAGVGFTGDDLNKTELEIQIGKFQKNAGIKVTGTLTGSTMLAAKSPRCGQKENEHIESSDHGNSTRVKRYAIAGHGNKWPKNEITWKLNSYPTSNKITRHQVLKDIRGAFRIWSDVTPLEFKQVDIDTDADIRMDFAKLKHGTDKREPLFDGRGGVLAHAFYPNSGWYETNGDVHFDDDEEFTYKDKQFGTNLFYTAAHEIGHALGLMHSGNPDALMNAWDKGYVKNFRLPKDDELGIQAIYGANPNRPSIPDAGSITTTAPDRTMPKPTEIPSHGDCENAHIAVTVIGGSLFVFQGEYLWRYQGEHVNQRLLTPLHGYPIKRYFKNGPKSIDTAFTYANGSTVFIRGKNMWTFDIRTRRMVGEPGLYPMRINTVFGIPKDIDASFVDESTNVAYFFKGDELWKYDTHNNRLLTPPSINATDEFDDLPSNLNGAYTDHDGHRFFIKGQKYWQYNEDERQISPGFPKLFAFLDCH